MLVPRFLEVSIESLTREQEKFRQQMSQAFGTGPFAPLEEQVRRNMEMFERAFSMFAPFTRRDADVPEPPRPPEQSPATEPRKPAESVDEIDDLKRQLDEVQKRLNRLSETKG
jgi:polyhydroxyalkanoate synthesis regulator protein